jgi:hypothetical protein
MNNPNSPLNLDSDEMLPEYDFSVGTRGKHYQAYRQGHSVTIYQEDGTTIVRDYPAIEAATILLDPDVKPYFPDSQAVNHALCTLINLVRSPTPL